MVGPQVYHLTGYFLEEFIDRRLQEVGILEDVSAAPLAL